MKNRDRSIILAFVCCLVCIPVFNQSRPAIPDQLGIDLDERDLTIRPGDNFFRYANGRYLDRLVIPPDRSVVSTASMLTDSVEAEVRGLLEVAVREHPDSPARMAGDYYTAFMDQSKIEQIGITPLLSDLRMIQAASSRQAVASFMGRENSSLFGSIFHLEISSDIKDPEHYAVQIGQPDLALPERSYYLDAKYSMLRSDYKDYIVRLLRLANWPEPRQRAEEIVGFERSIARASWGREQERDPQETYNPVSLESLQREAGGFPWSEFLTTAGLGDEKRLIVVEQTAVPKIAGLFAQESLETLQAWEAFALLDNAAPYLSQPFADAAFEFHSKSFGGQKRPFPRWKEGLRLVSGGNDLRHVQLIANVGDAVGQLYVAHYFREDERLKMGMLVTELKAVLRARLESLIWMQPATKAEALRKLEKYTIQIGYPDHWRDYSSLQIEPGDLIRDIERASVFNWQFQVNRLHAPVDRYEWAMEPQTVNAYNDGPLHLVVFSAALLQPPAFDPGADPAVNYGAIGAIIGHELTHSFDDVGRRFDSDGRMRDWWGAEDSKRFLAMAANLGAQVDSCEPLAGMHANGKLTMGENIADLGGLALALDAYHASLKGMPAPVIDGLSGDQRFFLSFAHIRRSKRTQQSLQEQVLTDTHSPDECRVNIEVRNLDSWYSAFSVREGDKLYLTPEKRVRLW